MAGKMTTPNPPTISLCMIVKNEERNLPGCLRSVRGVVDEIVVVDTGSEDATQRIAASHGAVLLHHRWQDDFAAARNVGLERATGEWILVLDADEELEEETRWRLRRELAGTRADGLQMVVRSLAPEGDLQRYDDITITRLFRNRPEYRYEQPIHEQIRPAIERLGGRIEESDLVILHYGYARPLAQGTENRALRNLRLLERALARSPDDPYLHFQLGATYKSLGRSDLAYSSLRKVLELDCRRLDKVTLDKLYMTLARDELGTAAHFAEASLARNPDNEVSRHLLALAHILRGDVHGAYPHFLHLRRHATAALVNQDELDAVLDYCRRSLSGPTAEGSPSVGPAAASHQL